MRKVLGILVFLNILAWIAVFNLSRPQVLEVIFFDVGQGDAIFIETPEKQQILIDGGPSSVILEKLAKEMPFWDRTIDLVILTHPEADHLAGLIEVFKRYKIENILWTGVVRDSAEYKEWKRAIKEEGANIKIAQNGQRIIASKTVLEVLYPFENLEGKELKNSNDTSIVSKLVFNDISFLFTGDISQEVEKALVLNQVKHNLIDSDVLKVAHHGSKYSSSEEFLATVSPELAVIQVGKSSYGHPAQELLNRLKNFDIKILRTDKDGDIKIISDGKKLWFIQKKKKPWF